MKIETSLIYNIFAASPDWRTNSKNILVVSRCAVMVLMSRSRVRSGGWLILGFFYAAGLMVLVGAEFIAMLLVIVYVGAVGVLFLFVVMMLDINFSELRAGFLQYLPIGAVIGSSNGWIVKATESTSVSTRVPTEPQTPAGMTQPDVSIALPERHPGKT